MKTRTISAVLILIVLAVSCIPSLYPLYREKDLIFDDRLTGRFDIDGDMWEFARLDWKQENYLSNDWNQFRSGKTYKLIAWEDSKRAEFAVHLIKLRNNYYLDFFPVRYEINHEFLYWHLIPAHIFGKIEFVENNITINWFDGDFLTDMIDSNKVKISHKMLEEGILLTAKTEELQKFVKKFGDYPGAYIDQDPDTLYHITGTF
jgi:hypothetical protein